MLSATVGYGLHSAITSENKRSSCCGICSIGAQSDCSNNSSEPDLPELKFGSGESSQHARVRKVIREDISNMSNTEQTMVEELLISYGDIFAQSDTDLGKFKATDNGPSVVSFHLKDPTKIFYAVPRRVSHG